MKNKKDKDKGKGKGDKKDKGKGKGDKDKGKGKSAHFGKSARLDKNKRVLILFNIFFILTLE